MSLFKSGNPAFGEKAFGSMSNVTFVDGMTVKGTLNKFGFMLLMLMGSAYYSWKEVSNAGNFMPLVYTGLIGGFVLALVIIFKKEWSPYLAPAYALMEGFFLGAVSAVYNDAFAETAPNIVVNAIGLTFGVAVAMYFMYSRGIIKVTEKFRSVIMLATAGIAIFYFVSMILGFFGFDMAMLHEGSLMGIGFSLVVVVIASLNLLLDFDMIEQGAQNGAPKYMEWYGAFGLMVTIVWLYLEILRLLSKFSSRK